VADYLAGRLGYEVRAAADGREAIELALAEAFDLCIIDVILPDLSGSEVYTRLRSIRPNIEAIFFTGVAAYEESQDFLRFSLPPERVIAKPLKDMGALTRLIVSILGPPPP